MLDIAADRAAFLPQFERGASNIDGSALELIARQTHALEFIAYHLGALSAQAGQPIELRPDYELARSRLLAESI